MLNDKVVKVDQQFNDISCGSPMDIIKLHTNHLVISFYVPSEKPEIMYLAISEKQKDGSANVKYHIAFDVKEAQDAFLCLAISLGLINT